MLQLKKQNSTSAVKYTTCSGTDQDPNCKPQNSMVFSKHRWSLGHKEMPSSFQSAWSVCLPSTKRCRNGYTGQTHTITLGASQKSPQFVFLHGGMTLLCHAMLWRSFFPYLLQPLVSTIERQNIRIARKPEAKHGITEVQVVPSTVYYKLYIDPKQRTKESHCSQTFNPTLTGLLIASLAVGRPVAAHKQHNDNYVCIFAIKPCCKISELK